MIVAAILLIGGARMHELWGDEAETALFARNILKFGVPRGWDGVNIMGMDNGLVLNENLINHTSPWAQYYMVAASFALFGQSSFTARIPSILLYLISIPIIYYLAIRITSKKRLGLLATIIAALSVQGILFGYQARYYELTNVCGLLFSWASLSLVEEGFWPSVLFILSGIMFYYANYVSWSAFYVATFVVTALYVWIKNDRVVFKRFIKKFLLLTIPIVVACLPWFLAMRPFGSRGFFTIFPLSETISSFWSLSIDAWRPFHTAGVLPIGLVGLLVFVLVIGRRRLAGFRPLVFFVLLPFLFLTIMTAYSAVAYVNTNLSNPRYTTVALAFFYMLGAFVFDELISWQRVIGVTIFLIYLTTSLLTFNQPRNFLYLYIREVVHPYQTPEILVADFLKTHASKGQTAFVNLDHDHEPLIFLLGDAHALAFVNRVDPINTQLFPKNRGIIPRYIYDFRNEPDWLIMYSKRQLDGTFFTIDFRPLWPEVDVEKDYIEHILPIFFGDGSRPEVELRQFASAITVPRDYVYIYEKKHK